MSPRPIAHICCSPPERVPAELPAPLAQAREQVEDPRELSARRARAARVRAPSSRFSSTVIVGKSWRPSGTWAMPRATICGGR